MIENAIAELLRGSKDVTDMVGNRIGPELGTSKEQTPYITYRRISTDPLEGSLGSTGTSRAAILVTPWSESYRQTKQLAEFIRLALQGFEGGVAGHECLTITMTDMNDITQEPQSAGNRPTFGVEIDFGVWFAETIPS